VVSMKYVIVTGGVLSGLGKGITASSSGMLLQSYGNKVTAVKIDPYLNCDAGTMNPYQHGEVFVLDDGTEVDLDLGNYERFLDQNLGGDHNITTGKVYRSVIRKERKGEYLGNTVQIIPHITNEIKAEIKKAGKNAGADVTIIEVGGTVGDIESAPFLEALRQLHREVGGRENCIFIHTTLVPIIGVVGEQKTKPTQHSVKALMSIGIHPDVIVARCSQDLEYDIKRKISLFCDVPLEAVISAPDAKHIYEVPLMLERQGLSQLLINRLGLNNTKKLEPWEDFVYKFDNPKIEIEVAIVGKYTHLADSYISHKEALMHSGAESGSKIKIRWVEAEDLEKGKDTVEGADAIIIPGGFGKRGIEGKMLAIKHARENKIPFLGICLGFQLSIIEFARNKLGMEEANSTEFKEDSPFPVVDLLPEQKEVEDMGATMRLGTCEVNVKKDTIAYGLYNSTDILERHRHRFEINPDFIKKLEEGGLRFSGTSHGGKRMEIAELLNHPYFLASQYHPEFKSRPNNPAPLYKGLVEASIKYKREKTL